MESGQIAYEAYCDAVGWTSVHGERLPGWHKLNEKIKDGWRAAAHAAIQKGWVNSRKVI